MPESSNNSRSDGEQDAHSGGCLCGAIRYQFSGTPIAAVHCHCLDCQKATGSGFATVLGTTTDLFKLLQGDASVKDFTVKARSGNAVTRQFCSDCGSPLFTRAELNPDLLWIKAGSLDDSSWVEPTASCWTGNAQSWAPAIQGLQAHEENP